MPGLRRQECVGDSVCALVVAECAKAILCRITYQKRTLYTKVEHSSSISTACASTPQCILPFSIPKILIKQQPECIIRI